MLCDLHLHFDSEILVSLLNIKLTTATHLRRQLDLELATEVSSQPQETVETYAGGSYAEDSLAIVLQDLGSDEEVVAVAEVQVQGLADAAAVAQVECDKFLSFHYYYYDCRPIDNRTDINRDDNLSLGSHRGI
jgi:hypothetical protein